MPIDPQALIAASRAAPALDPSILYGAASTAPDDAVTNAQATYAYGDVTKRVSTMKGQDPSVQRSIWAGLSPEEQNQFTSAGYGGPPQPHGQSLFGSLSGAVGHVLAKVSAVPLGVAGEALHYAGAPLRALQHGFRAGARLSGAEALGGAGLGAVIGGALGSVVPVFGTAIGAGVGGFLGGAALPALSHPTDWADSWKKTEHGETTFMPEVERKVQTQYGTEVFNLASQLAGGSTQEKILSAVPEADRQALATRLRDDKDLAAATAEMADGKISFGRLITQSLGLHSTHGLGMVISGATDGVADWFGDPAMAIGKGAKASELVRYGVKTGEDVDRLYQSRPAVKAAFDEVGQFLARHHEEVAAAGGGLAGKVVSGESHTAALGELLARHPKLESILPELVKEKVSSGPELVDWMSGQKGFESLLQGQVTGAAKQALLKGESRVLLPHMTALTERALDVKAGARAAIDFMAGSDSRFPRALGRFGRMATTLTPRGLEFDINGDGALTTIQRVAASVLPDARVNDYVGAWAAADVAGKRTLYKGLLGEVFDHAGINDTPEGQQWASRFIDTIGDNAKTRAYATGGADVVNLPSGAMPTGFLEGHLQETWSLPAYKQLWAQGKRVGAGKALDMTFNNDMLDRFMQNTWKPLSLLRLGFPLRSGGEELVASIMREGVKGIAQGRLAGGALKAELPGAQAGTHFLPRLFDRITSDLTEEEKLGITTPGTMVGKIFGNRAARAMAGVKGALAGDEYMNAARDLYERGTLGGAFAREISAVEAGGGGMLWDTNAMNTINREGGRVRGMVLKPTGDFKDYLPSEPHFEQIWRRNLEELGDSNLGRLALTHVDDREAAVNAIVDHLESPGFSRMRDKATRSRFLRDGRSVEAGEATSRDASIDWANTVIDHADSTIHNAAGERVLVDGKGLADHVLEGNLPSGKALGDLGLNARPAGLKGPVVAPEHQSAIAAIADKGFSKVVGPMMDWMAREPLFIHNYATSMKETAGLRGMLERSGMTGDALEQHLHDVGVERAVNKTIPFIHDPRMRSQMHVVTRNMMPFQFAQEQFFKRWVTIFKHSPEALREAQLTMNGIRHMGMVHTDEQGNDYFMYPAVAPLQNVLLKGFSLLTGHQASIPLPLNFSGQVRFATPGLERLGLPSFGPLVSLPMTALTNRYPELNPAATGVLGERGSGRPLWEQLMPTTLSRAIHAISDTADNPGQMHSATMQAMAYLEANGHGVADDATPVEKEAWMDRVKNWARVMMVARTLYGFAAPAAPQANFDPKNLHGEFQKLLTSMPIDQAVGTFMKAHPDGTAYTVFQTKSASGAPLPATVKTLDFMHANQEFLSAYPQAGGWFLPQGDKGGTFSMPAYREQMSTEMRKSKTLDEYYRNIKFSEAADTYFTSKDKKDAALKTATGAAAAQIRQQWSVWKDAYSTAHPIFAEELLSSDGQIRRGQTLDQLRTAIDDPRMPATPQTEAMSTLVRGWDLYQSNTGALVGRRDFAATHQRANLKAAFTNWSADYVKVHPEVKTLFQRTMQIELEA